MLLHIQALEYDMGIQKHHMLRVPGLGVPVGPLGFEFCVWGSGWFRVNLNPL